MIDEKQALREQAILHRDRLRPEDEDTENAATLFKTHVPVKEGHRVAVYWPTAKEFDVRYIIDDLLKAGVIVALPVASKDNRVMSFSRWDGKTDLVKGDFGIYVPPVADFIEPEIIIVPFLAFDRKGNRLGRGGGHYDATLADLRQKREILAVGVGYAAQAVLFNLPVDDHDQRLDLIITPAGVHDFRS